METIYNFLIEVEQDLLYGEHGLDTLLLFFIAFFLFGIFLTVFANGLDRTETKYTNMLNNKLKDGAENKSNIR